MFPGFRARVPRISRMMAPRLSGRGRRVLLGEGGEEEMGTTKIRSRSERKVEEEEEGRCRRQARSM